MDEIDLTHAGVLVAMTAAGLFLIYEGIRYGWRWYMRRRAAAAAPAPRAQPEVCPWPRHNFTRLAEAGSLTRHVRRR